MPLHPLVVAFAGFVILLYSILVVVLIHERKKKCRCRKMPDARIRKVKALKGRAKEEAKRRGFSPNDLVIVTTRIDIEKIDGDPVSYLLKRANGEET